MMATATVLMTTSWQPPGFRVESSGDFAWTSLGLGAADQTSDTNAFSGPILSVGLAFGLKLGISMWNTSNDVAQRS